MKRGYRSVCSDNTEDALSTSRRLTPARLAYDASSRRRSSCQSFDSGIGSSFCSTPLQEVVSFDPVRTPKLETSSMQTNSMFSSSRSLFDSPLRRSCGFKEQSSPAVTHSSSNGPSHYRFDGNQLNSLGSGLIKIDSPQAASLSARKLEANGRMYYESVCIPPAPNFELETNNLTPPKTSRLHSTPPSQGHTWHRHNPLPPNTSTPMALPAKLVHPSGPQTNQSPNKLFPRTPTPFKKALAELQRSCGPIDQSSPDTPKQLAKDLREILQRDSTLASVHEELSTSGDFNSTPSKMCNGSGMINVSPLKVVQVANQLPSNSPHQSHPHYSPPSPSPTPMSNQWFNICCGRTYAQLDMLNKARIILVPTNQTR